MFEYKVIETTSRLEQVLNEYGSEGYRVIHASLALGEYESSFLLIMERAEQETHSLFDTLNRVADTIEDVSVSIENIKKPEN